MAPSRKIRTLARKLGDERGPLIAHWALALNDPAEVLFEIKATRVGFIKYRMDLVVTKQGEALTRKLAAFWEFDPLGYYTRLEDDEIEAMSAAIIAKNNSYNLLTNNCQHFVKALFKSIRDSGRGGDDTAEEAAIDGLHTEPEVKSLESLGIQTGEVSIALEKAQAPTIEDLLNIWAQALYEDMDKETQA